MKLIDFECLDCGDLFSVRQIDVRKGTFSKLCGECRYRESKFPYLELMEMATALRSLLLVKRRNSA